MANFIVAQATYPAPSAIGILRLSGEGCVEAVDNLLKLGKHGDSSKSLTHVPPRTLVYATLHDSHNRPIDHVLATYSKAPHSYTGEDTAELHCHGSPLVLALAQEALFAQGGRPAQRGEFTQRAFLHGKLDLPQAEGVADLLEAQSPQGVYLAVNQLAGSLSRQIIQVYDSLVSLMAHFHAVLDYPDEDIDPFGAEEITTTLTASLTQLDALIQSYERGKYLAQGLPCALVGLPNVGKSSLLNALLGYDRAIVSEIPGTTRDTIEESCHFGGLSLRFIDTAGLRETQDPVERLGVERSRTALSHARLVLILIDSTAPNSVLNHEVLSLVDKNCKVLYVYTKQDLLSTPLPTQSLFHPHVSISAKTGFGIDALSKAIATLFPPVSHTHEEVLLTNLRQVQAAQEARDALASAQEGLHLGITPDAVLTDVEGAMTALAQLMGRELREDVVHQIFSRFCVGK